MTKHYARFAVALLLTLTVGFLASCSLPPSAEETAANDQRVRDRITLAEQEAAALAPEDRARVEAQIAELRDLAAALRAEAVALEEDRKAAQAGAASAKEITDALPLPPPWDMLATALVPSTTIWYLLSRRATNYRRARDEAEKVWHQIVEAIDAAKMKSPKFKEELDKSAPMLHSVMDRDVIAKIDAYRI